VIPVNVVADAVLLDIEGTISPIAFVRDVLVPYARERLSRFVTANARRPEIHALLDDARALAGDDEDPIVALHRWLDADEKVAPLKKLQGLIWESGFRSGALASPLFPDALRAIERWRGAGLPHHIYSSGSVKAQHLFFEHTEAGNLRSYFAAHFDTDIGPKTSKASYLTIAETLGVLPTSILFLSDSAKELAAATAAGLQCVQVVKDATEADPSFLHITSFDTLNVSGRRREFKTAEAKAARAAK
jgi:enolase-phosphatase E1